MKKLRTLTLQAAWFVLRMVIVFVAVEGICGVVIAGCKMRESLQWPRPGGNHSRFDPEIGWVNLPSYHGKDAYGKGGHVTTNARGFRSATETEVAVPPGKVRLLCSGDSFTFGYGVGDGESYCDGLRAEAPQLETANLGIPGYGIDQAFLLYRREGTKVDHDLHVLGFIKEDFDRMGLPRFSGGNKPVFKLRDGALTLDHVPVAKGGFSSPTLGSLGEAFKATQIATLAAMVRGVPRRLTEYRSQEEQMDTALAVLEEANRVTRSKNAVFVAVFLPTVLDYGDAGTFQAYLRAELTKRGVPFVDLTADFKALPLPERMSLYIPTSAGNAAYAAKHYNAKGNRFVARALHQHLQAIPAAAEKLARR